MSTEATFLDCSIRYMEETCARIETCLEKIPADKVWLRGGQHQNAVGNLVLHLCGNIRQWILTSIFNEPDHREYDKRPSNVFSSTHP